MDNSTLLQQTLNQLEHTRALAKAFYGDLAVVQNPEVQQHCVSRLNQIHDALRSLNSELTVPLF